MFECAHKASRVAMLIILLIAVGCGAPSSTENDPQVYYKNNVLTIVVGVNPGGGFDEYARMVGAAIEEHTGGTVVVENQPGGGTLLALNRLVQGRADGLTLMLVGGEAVILAQLTNRPGTRFDIRELNLLGRVQKDTPVVLWSPTNPERNFIDVLTTIREKGTVWGASGLTDNISDAEAVMAQALGLSSEQMGIIIGYSGSSETALATVRGEVDGMIVSSTSAINYVSTEGEGGLVPVAVLDRNRDNLFFPDVPTIFELIEMDEEGSWWIDFRTNVTALGRTFVTHGDVSENLVAYLRSLLADVLTDERFIAEGLARKRPINYLSAEEQEQLVESLLSELTEERRQEVKYVITEKYIR
ncbi:MAG: tripartite-type tricarboxylate transporter receptor subunit TctC [Gammaproteobacteria bacterium]